MRVLFALCALILAPGPASAEGAAPTTIDPETKQKVGALIRKDDKPRGIPGAIRRRRKHHAVPAKKAESTPR